MVVTRARAQAEGFAGALEALGAEVVLAPLIRCVGPADPAPLLRAAREVERYDWVVFTSVNGVEGFWDALREVGRDARVFEGVGIACVGPATAAAVEDRGVRVAVMPERHVAEAVVEALSTAAGGREATGGRPVLAGQRILLPLAADARPVLAEGLAARGARVERVEAYRSVPDPAGAAVLRRELAGAGADVITFTAASTVAAFVDGVGGDPRGALIAAIGPVTAAAARRHGLPVAIVAENHTIPGLVAALRNHLGGGSGSGQT